MACVRARARVPGRRTAATTTNLTSGPMAQRSPGRGGGVPWRRGPVAVALPGRHDEAELSRGSRNIRLRATQRGGERLRWRWPMGQEGPSEGPCVGGRSECQRVGGREKGGKRVPSMRPPAAHARAAFVAKSRTFGSVVGGFNGGCPPLPGVVAQGGGERAAQQQNERVKLA
jgi:hypothetical protein